MFSFISHIVSYAKSTSCIIVDKDNWHDKDEQWQHKQEKNKNQINQLEINDDRNSVILQLGAPEFSEAFSKNKNSYRILYYRTQHKHSDGETSKDETTPLVFKNDKLIGWGQQAVNAIP